MPKKSLLYIGNKLSAKGKTATTIDTLSPLLQSDGFRVYTASSVTNKYLRFVDMLYKTYSYRNKVNLVLIDTYSTQNFYYALAVGSLCRLLKLPYIPILHGGNLPARLKKNPRLCSFLFNYAKANVVPSEYLLDTFIAEGYTNLVHIPNVMEINKYPFKPRKKVEAKLLWVRAFAEIYNPLLALQLVEKLMKTNIEVFLCMVGPEKDGSLSKCKKYAQDKNLPVIFKGKLEKEEWISVSQEYDIFLNTTNFDNMPVSIIEAMALGFPVISTNVGGLHYLIEKNKTGILIPPNNVEGFENAIITLLNNPEMVADLSTNARRKAESFDWEKVKHLWTGLLAN